MNCVYVFGNKEIAENVIDKKIVVFGAGGSAKTGITKLGIADKVEILVDNDNSKWGKYYHAGGRKWPVESPKVLETITEDYVVLIISQYYAEIVKQLENSECLSDRVCLIYITYSKGNLTDRTLSYYKELLELIGIDTINAADLAAEKERLFSTGSNGEKPFVMPRITFQVTTKCTLRCAGCNTLAPYFKKHFEYDIAVLKNDMNNMLRAVNYTNAVVLVGGETFLYPYLAEAIKYAAAFEQVFKVLLFTNATIIPDRDLLNALKNPKVFVEITDYGNIAKTGKLVSILNENNIQFRVRPCMNWIDYGDAAKRCKSIDELKINLKSCACGHYVKRMANGRLWGCFRGCILNLLGNFDSIHDSVLIKNTDTTEEIREKILYLFNLDYLESCDYCDYGTWPHKTIAWTDRSDPNGTKNSKYTIIPLDEYIALAKFKEEHFLYTEN